MIKRTLIYGALTLTFLGSFLTESYAQNETRKSRKKTVTKPAEKPKKQAAPNAPKGADPKQANAATATLKGMVADSAKTEEGLAEATVLVLGTQRGAYTNFDGAFQIDKIPAGEYDLQINYIGYQSQTVRIKLQAGQTLDLGAIKMRSNAIGVEEIEVIASYASDRKTPVAFSQIDAQTIADKAGPLKFPDVMRTTPSFYTSRLGGGFGDSRVSIRGFDQSNVAVLINGVPFNDMSSGWLYWSNFIGISDVTQSVQIQRGLGASRLAINSIGGTVNMITKNAEMERHASVSFETSNVYSYKASVFYSTGRSKKGGWSGSMGLTKMGGKGYIEQTDLDAWFYFAAVTKEIGKNHLITLNAFGAPQTHYQRETFLTKTDVDNYGTRYNPDWGYDNGKPLNLFKNYFHKPQITLSHHWTINDRMKLSTSAYVSPGTGGGVRPTTVGYKIPRDSTGRLNWAAVRAANAANVDTFTTTAGETVIGSAAKAVLRDSHNDQIVTGVLSTLTTNVGKSFVLTGGLDLRYSKTHTYRTIENLLGADFYVDKSNVNNPMNLAKVGDKIAYDRDELVSWVGVFGQAEYNWKNLTTFASFSFSNTFNQRVDRFLFKEGVENNKTPNVSVIGYNAKLGANYNISKMHSVFVNSGVYSRAPYIPFIFVGAKNEQSTSLANETIIGVEGGYNFSHHIVAVKLDGYYTIWKDKQLLGRRFYLPDGSSSQARLNGLGAEHMGLELEVAAKPIKQLKLSMGMSVGRWKWKNDVMATTTNDVTGKIDTFYVIANDLNVGNQPQFSIVGGIQYQPIKNVKIGTDLFYYSRFYANFDVTARNNPNDRSQPYQLPNYFMLDLNASYTFKIWKLQSTLRGNIQNLFNARYIAESNDGKNHDYDTSTYFFGFGRTWSVALEVKF